MPSRVPADRLFRASKTLHRSTQELSLQVAELDAALTRDEGARFRQAVGAQQRVRIAAALALAVAAIVVRGGLLVPIAIVTVIAGLYLVYVTRIGTRAGQPDTSSRKQAISLAAADAVAVIAMTSVAAAGGTTEVFAWILVGGAIAAPAMGSAFGARSGTVSFALFGAGYLALELLSVGLGNASSVDALTAIATVALWGAGTWLLVRHLAQVRHRLDTLRTYAKLAEVGDVGTSDMFSSGNGSDDFALIARSLDAVYARLSDQIGSDPLTGCANRRGLERQLLGVCRLARRREGIVAVCAIDIDFFKQINDTHGHPEGDRVLRQLATIMMNTARDTDTVARLGGDEFVVLLPDSDWRGARAFAERLRDRVRESSFGPPGGSIPVTLSIGVAVGESQQQLEPDELLSQADLALYEAKAGGRDRVAGNMSAAS